MAYHANDGLPRLAPLHDLRDFKVANNNLDVRGWEVIGSDGKRIGKVDDLIVDRELMKVRYLDVDVDKDRVLPDTDARHILVPIGAAQLDDDSDQVFVGMDQMSLSRFPFYRGGAVDADYEYRVMHAITSPNETYSQQTASPSPSAEFYGREQFNEDRFYGNRHQRGQSIPQDQSHFHSSTSSSSNFGSGSTVGSSSNLGSGSNLDGRPVQDDIATIERLRTMLEQGTITQDEFTALKRKAIGL
ncbi:PRC-barrel domain-containing protein [Rufibacter sediminis]|uniref:PRC-barrel domain-containing protein n=1 Tax=Rufibacter sediminis TaxID=2762756 RepID=A0ABR6VTI6_9BACT|nr:PRC-barrel domain-containing protein [Rufibacter sediminis]MBC3540515.1 PRC-barrel domain-containing protein [Rufibacter sediminis]